MKESSMTRRAMLVASGGIIAANASMAWASGETPQAEGTPTAQIKDGRLAGLSRNGIQVFMGIPYGAPTGGARRFLPPAPPKPWNGVRTATRLGQRAPQTAMPVYELPVAGPYMSGGREDELFRLQEPMGEDCLVLNVLTPRADGAGRPVMVYIHGGGFTTGSGATMTMSDRFVTENDTVVITVNHRLGALGYAYLGGLSSRYQDGNPGMLDLVAALKWVGDNVHAFGGDPAKVTLFGESGGGAKIALLMAMPQAAGLFRGAIIESGVLPSPQPIESATEAAQSFLKRYHLSADNLAALQTMSPYDLQTIATSWPVADGHTLAADPWRQAPSTAASIPLIIGNTSAEESGFYVELDPSVLKLTWLQLPGKLAREFHRNENELVPAIDAYKAVYPREDATGIFLRMTAMNTMGRAALEIAKCKSAQPAPVFLYRFQYDPGLAGLRAFHTAELPLTMRMVLQPAAENLSRRIAGAWANFARDGDPNGPGLPAWPRYEPAQQPIMIFARNVIPAGPDPELSAQQRLLSIIGEAPGRLPSQTSSGCSH